MAYQYYQPNPKNQAVGDCVIRAICRASGEDWYRVYTDVVVNGYALADMPIHPKDPTAVLTAIATEEVAAIEDTVVMIWDIAEKRLKPN